MHLHVYLRYCHQAGRDIWRGRRLGSWQSGRCRRSFPSPPLLGGRAGGPQTGIVGLNRCCFQEASVTLRIRVCRLMLVPDASDKTTECHIRKIFHFTVVGDSLTEQPKRRYAKTQNTSQQHFFGGARYSKSAPMRPQTEGLQGPPTVCEVQGQPCEVHEPCGPTVAFTLGLLGLQIYIHTYIATA